MKKLALLLTLFSFVAHAGTNPVIWGPGNKATVIPPILVVGGINYSGGGSSTPQTTTWTSPTAVTGTVANTAGGTTVTGTGTKFLSEFHVGDSITIGGQTVVISAIASDVSMTTAAISADNSGGGVVATRAATTSFYIYPNGVAQSGGTRTTLTNLSSATNSFLAVSSAASAAATSASSPNLKVIGYAGAVAASPPTITLFKSRGVEASPVVLSSGDTVGAINFGGWDSSSFQTGSQIQDITTELWSASARGNKLTFSTVPNTTISRTTALTLDQDQSATFAGPIKFAAVLASPTAPTISSGFGSTPSIASNNGTAAFTVNVGTGGVATSGVIGLPTATTGWNCFCTDITTKSATVFVCKQTATATTSATIGNFNTSGAAAAWVASDIVTVSCFAY